MAKFKVNIYYWFCLKFYWSNDDIGSSAIFNYPKMAVYTLYDAINAGEYGVACLMSAMIILVSVFVSWLVNSILRERMYAKNTKDQ